MKYAKFSDDFLSDFRLDDNGETLVLTDKRGYTRAVKLLPYEERQGKWIKSGKTTFFCSECGREINTKPFTRPDNFPFCHCGAEMKNLKRR